MALRARAEVESNWDTRAVTERLVESYRTALDRKRGEPARAEAATCR
jgi:hypothetical protein